MDIGENIADSFKYTFSDIKNLIIFMLIFMSCIIIVTIPLFLGYIYRITKETVEGSDVLPDFSDLGQMYIDGLKILGLGIIYVILIILVFSILMGIGITIGSAMGDSGVAVFITIFTIIGCIMSFIIGLFYIPAQFKIITEDSFSAGFDFSGIMELIKDVGIGEYIIWYIAILIISSIISGIGSLLAVIIVGPVIASTINAAFTCRSTALLFGFK